MEERLDERAPLAPGEPAQGSLYYSSQRRVSMIQRALERALCQTKRTGDAPNVDLIDAHALLYGIQSAPGRQAEELIRWVLYGRAIGKVKPDDAEHCVRKALGLLPEIRDAFVARPERLKRALLHLDRDCDRSRPTGALFGEEEVNRADDLDMASYALGFSALDFLADIPEADEIVRLLKGAMKEPARTKLRALVKKAEREACVAAPKSWKASD